MTLGRFAGQETVQGGIADGRSSSQGPPRGLGRRDEHEHEAAIALTLSNNLSLGHGHWTCVCSQPELIMLSSTHNLSRSVGPSPAAAATAP